jgi:murein DD-endopeptidase MepM/ murein hydrolase activator NlpD
MNRLRRTALFAIFALLVTGALTGPAQADDLGNQRAQAEKQQAATDQRLADLKAALDETGAALADSYLALQGIQARLPQAQQELTAAKAALATAQQRATQIRDQLQAAKVQEAQLAQEIADGEAKAQRTRDSVAELARQAYRGDAAVSSLTIVLDSRTAGDFVDQYAALTTALRTQSRALDDLQQLGAVNRNRQSRLAAVRAQIAGLKAEADQKVVDANAARTAAAAREAEIQTLLVQQQRQTAIFEQQKADEVAQEAALEAQRAALEASIKDIIRQQVEAEAARLKASGRPGQPVGRGFLAYPTAVPFITSPYGMRFHPILHIWRLHAGTDFRAACGTAIMAAASGTVQWAKAVPGFGNQVMLNHGVVNGNVLWTSYNHLSRFNVGAGQLVHQGDIVGYSGSTGDSTACHLHFEVYVNGNTVDPMTIL